MKQIITILTLFVFSSVFSQSINKENLKVGLVLSGGGAKGLAHIGALKTIDSLGVKIDYIAGTSMGAIIGSLYASGYSGKQLDSIFRDVDFERISVGLYSCKIRYTPATLPVNTSKVALMFGDAVCRITAKFAGVESTWSYVQYQFETYTPDGVLSDDQLLGNNGTFFNVKIYN